MSPESCPICGLPTDLCTCKIIEREERKIRIYTTIRKFKKPITIVEGVDEKSGKSISKELKRKLACGGTFKNGKIELQGNHKERVKQLMVSLGFDENLIEVS
jgi:translation initiation factor 1